MKLSTPIQITVHGRGKKFDKPKRWIQKYSLERLLLFHTPPTPIIDFEKSQLTPNSFLVDKLLEKLGCVDLIVLRLLNKCLRNLLAKYYEDSVWILVDRLHKQNYFLYKVLSDKLGNNYSRMDLYTHPNYTHLNQEFLSFTSTLKSGNSVNYTVKIRFNEHEDET